MEPLNLALEALESLKPGEQLNYTQVAQKFGVSRTTLSRRHRAVQGTRAAKYNGMQLLDCTQEKELVSYIDGLCRRGLPPSRAMIRNFASEIAKRCAGQNWVDRFVARHNLDLFSKWTTGMDSARKRADSALKYSLYFELLRKKIEQYNVQPAHMYNMDEKGFLIGMLSKMKRIFSRHAYEKRGIKQIIQDGNREWITTIACICADGSALAPSLIYQSLSGNIQDTWLQDFDPYDHDTLFTTSPSGWTNHELGLAWLEQVFDRQTRTKARRSYRLLILDGHGSHVSMQFIDYCDKNRILLGIFPPHATHSLQPLDVVMFKPLSTAYSIELAHFMEKSQGYTSITKRDFFRMFNAAWTTSFQKKTILRAFEATGLSPFNPSKVLQRFEKKEQERPSSSESSTSILSASDWRKINRILHEIVKDIHDKQAQLVSRSAHTWLAKIALLEHENKGLKEALVNEKKRRQRGKPLLLEPAEEYAGGAVFWSPSKVQDARDRQAQKEADEEALQLQKTEEAKRREALKLEKATLLQERQMLRMQAKETRERQKLQKQVERQEAKEAREVARQLRNEAKAGQKGKKKIIQPEPSLIEVDVVELSPAKENSLPIRPTRHGRIPKPPKRFDI